MSSPPLGPLDRRSFLQGALLTAGSGRADVRSLVRPLAGQREEPSGSGQTLEIISTEEAELYYRFTVEGEVEKTRTSETVGAGDNDTTATGADEATMTVHGFTGNPGYGDAFEVYGDVRSFERTGGTSDFELFLDGREVSPSQLGGPDETRDPAERTIIESPIEGTLEIVSTEEAELYYDFTVEGEVEKTRTSDTVRAGDNDAIISGADGATRTARGFTGNPGYGDAYEVDGTLQVFRRTHGSSDFFLRLNGERLTPAELARRNVDPAPDCVHDQFRLYSREAPNRYANLRDDLDTKARDAELNRRVSQLTINAIRGLKMVARLRYGDYMGGAGEFLSLLDQGVEHLTDESNHPLYQSVREYTRTARFIHGLLYDPDDPIEEYVELVEEASELRDDPDADSMGAALQLAINGYTGTLSDDVTLMAVDVGELPLDSAVTGLDVNAQEQLMLKTFAESQLPVLDELARLTTYRVDGTLTEREMYTHFALRQEYWLAMRRFANHIVHLERLGREESVLFGVAREINKILGNDLLETAEQAADDAHLRYERMLEEMVEFREDRDGC